MFFVIESGSTKSDWVLIDNKNNQTFYSTMGFNPYFHSADLIEKELKRNPEIYRLASEIKGVYFYGAGCSSPKMNKIVEDGFSRIFTHADILVEHDLLACAYATYRGVPVISCIIGTGSNSCYFDGLKLSEEVPALGYVLGDEGSGSYFGKQLLAGYLYHKFSPEIEQDFFSTFGLDKEAIVDKVYCEPNANVFIASFMPFIYKYKSDEFMHQMLVEGFKRFIDVHVTCYPNYREKELNFVGSISSLFEEELIEAAASFSLTIGAIIRRPVDSLVSYHVKYILSNQLTQ